VPPFGSSEGTEIQDIFKVEHLLANSRLLDTSCAFHKCIEKLMLTGWSQIDRLPVPIAKYISRAVYENELESDKDHPIQRAKQAIVFIDVANGEEEPAGNEGKSWKVTLTQLCLFCGSRLVVTTRVSSGNNANHDSVEYGRG
jgi:hypothetical protein